MFSRPSTSPGAVTVRARATDSFSVHPPELHGLLHGADAASRDAAWAALVQSHNQLLLHAVRSVVSGHDAAMDAYVHVLERLREDDFRRLRGYVADGRSTFGTWLVVVARRLCIDHHRQRYGRVPRGEHDVAAAEQQRAARRRLLDLTTSPMEAADLVDETGGSADRELRAAELRNALDVALAALAPADRVLLKLRFEDALSAQEIAMALGWPTPFHVYRRLNALYADLRKSLMARGVMGSAP
jgi:RNA polymerase sigma factor (sigma-70 family)